MKSVDTLNIYNLTTVKTDVKSYDSKNSTTSENKSNSFDSYLKKSFNSAETTNVNANSQGKVDYNNNASCGNIKRDDTTKGETIKSSDVKNKIDDEEGQGKTDATDSNADTNVDLQSVLSAMLSCFNNGSFDLSKLKTQLDKLKVPEEFQKVIIDLTAKLQDSFHKSGNDDFMKFLTSNINSESTKNEHSRLIDNIVDVLKSKLNEGNNASNLAKLSSEAALNSKLGNKSENEIDSNVLSSGKNDVSAESLQDKYNIDNNTSSQDNKSFQKSDDSDEKSNDFLEKLLSKDQSNNDSKISKVTTFINQFSNVNTNVEAVKGEVQVINKNNFAADIVKSVKYMQDNNIKELTVKINPKELGEVVIRLSMENNIMKANISAQNKETYTLLQSSLGDINSSLNNQNIKIQAFSVNIYNDSTYFAGQGNNGNKQNNGEGQDNNNKGKEKIAEVKNESEDVRVDGGKVNMLA